MRVSIKFLLFSILIVAVVVSCNRSKFSGYKQTKAGLYYKIFNVGKEGKKPVKGDYITLDLKYFLHKKDKDSLLGDIKGAILRAEMATYKGDLVEGFFMMNQGDSASFMVKADSFFIRSMGFPQPPKFIDSLSYLKINIKMVKVQKEADYYSEQNTKEKSEIDKYLASNNITVNPTASGLYYVELKKGTGKKATADKTVKVHYTGMLTDGRVFDSSIERKEPIEYPLGNMIPGWVEGISLMQEGGKAKLVVPSKLAYGERGFQSIIPPFTPLVFEIELIAVSDAKPEGDIKAKGKR